MVILGEVLRQFWFLNTFLQVLITSYTRGEEDNTRQVGREVVDTLTVTQFFFHLPNIGRKVVDSFTVL